MELEPSLSDAKNGNADEETGEVLVILSEPGICQINKPLLPLKASLFLIAGSSGVQSFVIVHLKQKGIDVSQLSYIFIAIPIVQLLFSILVGIIIDKTGRQKIVFCSILILAVASISCFSFIPDIHVKGSTNTSSRVCHHLFNESRVSEGDCARYCEDDTFNSTCNFDYKLCCSYYLGNVTESLTNCSSYFKSLLVENFICGTPQNQMNQVHHEVLENPVLEKTSFSFIFLSIATVILVVAQSTGFRCMDVTSMHMTTVYNADLGKQTIWMSVGLSFLSPLFSLIVQSTTKSFESKNCLSAFYMYDFVVALLFICILNLDIQASLPEISMWGKAIFLFKDLDFFIFETAVLVLGYCFCFERTFVIYYMEQLGTSSILFGLKYALSSLFAIPLLLTSEWWIRKIGFHGIFLCSLIACFLQYLFYSFIVNPWWFLVCTPFFSFYFHFLWVAVVRYADQLAPEGVTATTISATGSIHSGLGLGISSLVGGSIMNKYGGRFAFHCNAGICLVSAVLYTLFVLARRHKKRDCFNSKKSEELCLKNKKIKMCYCTNKRHLNGVV